MAQERGEVAPEALNVPGRRQRPGLAASFSAWWNKTFESMSNRNLRILWIGTFLNFAGVTMNGTAQGVVAFDLTGNNRAVGAVMLGQGLSLLLISPFAGALADRFSKRTMLLICQLTLCLTFGFIGFAIAIDIINIPMLAVSSFIGGTMFAVIRPVRNAYIGELASPEQRGNAVAVSQLAMSAMQIVGPFLAGVLLGWSLVGSSGTYFVMAIAFIFAISTLFQLPATKSRVTQPGGPSILQETWAGLRYGWGHPEIRWVLAGFVMLTIVGTPYMTLLPGYVSEVLGMSTARLGVPLGISALGGFLVSLATASLADSPKAPMILFVCNLVFAASLIGLGLAPNFAAAAFVVLFLGAGASGFQMLNTAIALRAADLAYMGRVASLTMMAFSLSGIVAFPIGAAADAYGERVVLGSMGVAVFIVSIILAAWKQQMIRSANSAASA
ncbi:MAG TPA: MFS transporter [Tepidiformaceae bacterium]|nr:MFS transporter [Tepidiformaceae bacterium]